MVKRNPRVAVMVAAVLAWAIVTPITWRDLRRRPADQVRGPKWLWRLASANLTGSVAYFLLGRKRAD
jgi:hypothetical protein